MTVQPVQPVPPVQPVTTRAGALVLRFEHWTPKGDCKVVATKKEVKKLPKKVHKKIEMIFNFI